MPRITGSQSQKSLIEMVRGRAGSATIPDGLGNIVLAQAIRGRLYIIAQNGICSSVFADQIDPERSNIDLPNLIQRVDLNYGAETNFVQRTICLGSELLKPGFLSQNFDLERALEICLESAYLFGAIQDSLNELVTEQTKLRAEDNEGKIRPDLLPQSPRLDSRVKQFIHTFRDLSTSIKALTLLFYPKAGKQRNEPWEERFKAAASLARGSESDFVGQLEAKLAFLEDVDSIRNALVHPDKKKWIKIRNYEMQSDGKIIPPTIEVETAQLKIPRMDLTEVLLQVTEHMSAVFEAIVCSLCDLNAAKFGEVITFGVVELPDSQRGSGSRYTWQIFEQSA